MEIYVILFMETGKYNVPPQRSDWYNTLTFLSKQPKLI